MRVPPFPTRPRTLRHSRDPDYVFFFLSFPTVQVTPRRDRRACCLSAAPTRFLWSSVAVYCCVFNRAPPPRIGFLFRELLRMIMKMVVGDLTAQADHRLFFSAGRIWSAKKQGDVS